MTIVEREKEREGGSERFRISDSLLLICYSDDAFGLAGISILAANARLRFGRRDVLATYLLGSNDYHR